MVISWRPASLDEHSMKGVPVITTHRCFDDVFESFCLREGFTQDLVSESAVDVDIVFIGWDGFVQQVTESSVHEEPRALRTRCDAVVSRLLPGRIFARGREDT